MNIGILNAFRFLNHNVDMAQRPQAAMEDDLYNALAFAEANALEDFVGCPEWQQACEEYVVELIGVTNWL